MSDLPPQKEMLASYISRYCDQSLSPEELDKLENWLASDRECMAQFLLQMEIHSALAWQTKSRSAFQGVASCDVQADAATVGRAAESNPQAVAVPAIHQSGFYFGFRQSSLLALATGILLTVLVYEKWVRPSGFKSHVSNATNTAQRLDLVGPTLAPVAYLTSVNGCEWGGGSLQSWTVGCGLESGSEIALREGIAEFRLESGVSFSVEGPAAMLVMSPTSLVLQQGKLTAYVPWEVKEFQLLASGCRMTARDAELGIAVTGGEVEVHSFAGEARVLPSVLGGFNGGAGLLDEEDEAEVLEPIVVAEGRAIVVPAAGKISEKPLHADRKKFVTKLSMGGHLPVTEKYVRAVKSSRPSGYWRFESTQDDLIANEVEGGQPLVAKGKVALSGDSKNRVLELASPNPGDHLISRDELSLLGSDYTIELWMKPSHFHNGVLATVILDGPPKTKHSVIFELEAAQRSQSQSPGSVRFLHRNPPGNKSGTWCSSNCLYSLRRWQYVVAVQERESMRVYLDGVLVATRGTVPGPAVRGLHLLIGQLSPNDSRRKYVGLLDELAIYNRALSAKEVMKHWQAMEFHSTEPASGPDT